MLYTKEGFFDGLQNSNVATRPYISPTKSLNKKI